MHSVDAARASMTPDGDVPALKAETAHQMMEETA